MSTKTGIVFPYFWYLDERNKEVTVIRVYCLDQNNRVICLMINDFTPYIYLELPKKTNGGSDITWEDVRLKSYRIKLELDAGHIDLLKLRFFARKNYIIVNVLLQIYRRKPCFHFYF